MSLSRIDPFGAMAGAAALSVKDALRMARRSLREGRRRMPAVPGDAPLSGVARGLIAGVDGAAETSLDLAARAARAAFAVSPLAPRRPPLAAALAALDAGPARGPDALAVSDGLYEAMRIVLSRLGGGEALVLEQPLAPALAAALSARQGRPAAERGAAAARAFDAAGAVVGLSPERARLGWFALGLALTAAASGAVEPGQERATLEAAADLALAIEAEALAAMGSGEGLAALLDAYAAHL